MENKKPSIPDSIGLIAKKNLRQFIAHESFCCPTTVKIFSLAPYQSILYNRRLKTMSLCVFGALNKGLFWHWITWIKLPTYNRYLLQSFHNKYRYYINFNLEKGHFVHSETRLCQNQALSCLCTYNYYL